MARVEHNKLIRDRIPEKIETSGDTYEVQALVDDDAYERALRDKVVEEAGELRDASGRDVFLSEYADLMVALDALTSHLEYSEVDIKTALSENLEKKGGFKKRLFLTWTETP